MKSIYDMMGKYTYPCMQEDAPREHVESFFQVCHLYIYILVKDVEFKIYVCLSNVCVSQKMDRNNDGVVTIDEFIESCQKVHRCIHSRTFLSIHTVKHGADVAHVCTCLTYFFSLCQDENIMQSMQLFDNVI